MPDRVSNVRKLLLPLSWLWQAGVVIDQARKRASQRALKTPVISIGALTMGGAGKTPMVLHLAKRLREMGRNPAILTRGYKRVSREPIVIVPRGAKASIESTGDEAQMFVRAGDAHVGIGADRYEVGCRIEAELAPDIFLLDDGFQHVQLHRVHDVVLVDGDDPEAGGVFPAGRLREPLTALERATEIIVTRGTGDFLQRFGYYAPVFKSRVVPGEFVLMTTGQAFELTSVKNTPIGAFCGLGQPDSFWRTLEGLGMKTIMRREFADHHRYSAAELTALAKDAGALGASALVTTEKDAMNLCEGAAGLVAPVSLNWLKIGIEIDREDEFLARITGTTV
jgi:tetraacyldisaccharide 4'-kinase